jgi:hypothetical protein
MLVPRFLNQWLGTLGLLKYDVVNYCSSHRASYLFGEQMKEFIVAEAKNGFVVRTNQDDLVICASLAQVKKVLVNFFEPKDIEVNDPPF